jgi:hypothetical protein
VNYFRNNAERMRYDDFRKRDLFVGSGVVEAGCKNRGRPASQAIGHALDRARRQRHYRTPLPDPQRLLGSFLGIAFGGAMVNKFVAHPLKPSLCPPFCTY